MVRAATVTDATFLAAMIREAILASPLLVARLGLDAVEQHEADYWRAWCDRDDRDPAFVATDEHGTPLGGLVMKPDCPAVDGRVARWRIGLGVVHSARSRGAGTELVERALDLAAALGADEVSLIVDPGNIRAIALYRRLGFVDLAERDVGPEMRRRAGRL
jgi:ribosomal protein S18 acetylase RimI-like enzyme